MFKLVFFQISFFKKPFQYQILARCRIIVSKFETLEKKTQILTYCEVNDAEFMCFKKAHRKKYPTLYGSEQAEISFSKIACLSKPKFSCTLKSTEFDDFQTRRKFSNCIDLSKLSLYLARKSRLQKVSSFDGGPYEHSKRSLLGNCRFH